MCPSFWLVGCVCDIKCIHIVCERDCIQYFINSFYLKIAQSLLIILSFCEVACTFFSFEKGVIQNEGQGMGKKEKATRLNLISCFIFVSQRIVNNVSQSFCFAMLSLQNPNAATPHHCFPFPSNLSCLANSTKTPPGFIYNCFLAVCKIRKVGFVSTK